MNNSELKVGLAGEESFVVAYEQTAAAKGSGAVKVFSTPDLITEMERVCLLIVEDLLGDEFTTVGTVIDIKHLAATPVGMNVKITGELIEIDRKRLVFKVEGFDEKEKIGEGLHERFIVNRENFTQKAESKTK